MRNVFTKKETADVLQIRSFPDALIRQIIPDVVLVESHSADFVGFVQAAEDAGADFWNTDNWSEQLVAAVAEVAAHN